MEHGSDVRRRAGRLRPGQGLAPRLAPRPGRPSIGSPVITVGLDSTAAPASALAPLTRWPPEDTPTSLALACGHPKMRCRPLTGPERRSLQPPNASRTAAAPGPLDPVGGRDGIRRRPRPPSRSTWNTARPEAHSDGPAGQSPGVPRSPSIEALSLSPLGLRSRPPAASRRARPRQAPMSPRLPRQGWEAE